MVSLYIFIFLIELNKTENELFIFVFSEHGKDKVIFLCLASIR